MHCLLKKNRRLKFIMLNTIKNKNSTVNPPPDRCALLAVFRQTQVNSNREGGFLAHVPGVHSKIQFQGTSITLWYIFYSCYR